MDEMQKRERKWRLTQNLGFLFPAIMGLALLILVVCLSIPNRPAAPEKVTRAMEDLGYSPWDSTAEYQQKWNMTTALASCLSVRTVGLRIDLFQAEDYYACREVCSKLLSYMNSVQPFPEDSLRDGNHDYSLYCIGNNGHYLMQVETRKTVLFIEWSSSQTPAVLEFLKAVDCPIPKEMKGWA